VKDLSSSSSAGSRVLTPVYEIDPLWDPRWQALLARDSRASIFHHPSWLDALRRTYGYQPTVLTTTPPGGELTNGVVLCRVDSWLTGRRMVSLPFSDHCEPLAESPRRSCIAVELLEIVAEGAPKVLSGMDESIRQAGSCSFPRCAAYSGRERTLSPFGLRSERDQKEMKQ